MNYRIIDRESYYRKGVFRHFSEDCKCSTSMTARIDVADLVDCSQKNKYEVLYQFPVYPLQSDERERGLQNGLSLADGRTDLL